MASRMKKPKKAKGKLVKGNFPLMGEPVSVQITKRVNQLIVIDKNYINQFRYALDNESLEQCDHHVSNLILSYGPIAVKGWFTLIYGWKFKKEIVA